MPDMQQASQPRRRTQTRSEINHMNRQIEEWKREITKPLPPDPTAAFIEVFARAGIVVMVLAPVAMVVVVLIIAASR